MRTKPSRLRANRILTALPLACLAGLVQAQTIAPLDTYRFAPTLGESSLPLAFVFGAGNFCLPGDSACKQPSFPAGIQQPAPVVVASTTIGTCPVQIRTGNIALRTWFKLPSRYQAALQTVGFTFPSIPAYNGNAAYFSALVDLVAVPMDPTRCRGGQVAPGAKSLGHVTWAGSVRTAGYDGRIQATTVTNAVAPSLQRLSIQWSGSALSLHLDDCKAPVLETPVHEARATGPAALFPVIEPHVTLSAAPAAVTPCKSLLMSALASEGGAA